MIAKAPYDASGDLLGHIVTWDMETSEVPLTKIRAALAKAGLDPDVARDLDKLNAFTRATKELKENRSIDKVHKGKDGIVRFQLTHKVLDEGNQTMNFDIECYVTLNKETGEITSANAVIEEKARELLAHAIAYRTSSDITRYVQKMFKDNADLFPINKRKGVAYYVPAQFNDFVDRIEMFLKELGGEIEPWPVPKGTERGNAAVRNAIASGLDSYIKELSDVVDNWDDSTRADTMSRGIAKWKEAKHKVESYAAFLEASKDGLDKKIAELKARLVEKASAKVRPKEESEETAEAVA